MMNFNIAQDSPIDFRSLSADLAREECIAAVDLSLYTLDAASSLLHGYRDGLADGITPASIDILQPGMDLIECAAEVLLDGCGDSLGICHYGDYPGKIFEDAYEAVTRISTFMGELHYGLEECKRISSQDTFTNEILSRFIKEFKMLCDIERLLALRLEAGSEEQE